MLPAKSTTPETRPMAKYYRQTLGLNDQLLDAGGTDLLVAYHLVAEQVQALGLTAVPTEARVRSYTRMHHHKVRKVYGLLTHFLLKAYPQLTPPLTEGLPQGVLGGYLGVTTPSKEGENPHGCNNSNNIETYRGDKKKSLPNTRTHAHEELGGDVTSRDAVASSSMPLHPPTPLPEASGFSSPPAPPTAEPVERGPMFPNAPVAYPPGLMDMADSVIAEIQKVQPVYVRPREDWAGALARVLAAYPNRDEFWAVLRYHLRADRFGWKFLMNPSRLMTPQKDNWVYLLADWQKAQKAQGGGKAHNVVALPTTNQPKAPSFDEFLQERFAPRRVQRWPKGVYKATCLETWEVEDVSEQVKALRQEFDAQQQPQEVQA